MEVFVSCSLHSWELLVLRYGTIFSGLYVHRPLHVWGLYHYRLDFPNRNDDEWMCNTIIKKSLENNEMTIFKEDLKPYLFDVNLNEEKYDVSVA